MTSQADSWIYDPSHGVYYQPSSGYYAVPDPHTGQWTYLPPSSFQQPSSSSSVTVHAPAPTAAKEDGEVEDDVGWGGLMEPKELEEAMKKSHPSPNPSVQEKHPAYMYKEPEWCGSARREATSSQSTPSHILRLVVDASEVLTVGGVAVIDAREGGVQIGRDRCEKGAQARLRLREMEVSKTHAVVYWGRGADEEKNEDEPTEGWWIVDLGSTHGTFVTSLTSGSSSEHDPKSKNPKPVKNEIPPADIDEKRSTDSRGPSPLSPPPVNPTRLSEAKHSSLPHPLSHLDTIAIGTTLLSAHIHPQWPCDTCQLGGPNELRLDDGIAPDKTAPEPEPSEHPVRWAMDSKERRENREVKRKREMAALRQNLLNGHTAPQAKVAQGEYQDRAAMRRRLHPPSPPPQVADRESSPPPRVTTPVSSTPAPMSQFASGMMARHGWEAGRGLGKAGEGRAEPVGVEVRTEKRGLGAEGSKAVVDEGEGDWKQRGKMRRWGEVGKQV